MRVPIGWLAEYVDVPAGTSVEDLDTAFVRLGLEVEEIHRPEEVTGPLVAGLVLAGDRPLTSLSGDALSPGHALVAVCDDVPDSRIDALGANGFGGASNPRLVGALAGDGWIDALDVVRIAVPLLVYFFPTNFPGVSTLPQVLDLVGSRATGGSAPVEGGPHAARDAVVGEQLRQQPLRLHRPHLRRHRVRSAPLPRAGRVRPRGPSRRARRGERAALLQPRRRGADR